MAKESEEDRARSEAEEREEDRRRFVGKMLDDPERSVTTFGMFMAASMAGGNSAKKAAGEADIAIAEIKRRFG